MMILLAWKYVSSEELPSYIPTAGLLVKKEGRGDCCSPQCAQNHPT